jgi:Family of unknown function (DUF6941)
MSVHSMSRAGPSRRLSFFLVLLLAGAGPACWADAEFLGLAVAQAISHDADGRVSLDGIHHLTRVSVFPHREDVCVYTRWSGSGTHDTDISIWNLDTEETVSEAVRQIDLTPDAVTTLIHTFQHATFPEGGTYAVEVTVDGDLAAEYSLFLNAHDSYPDTPELVLSVPAENASLDRTGNAFVQGIPEILSFPRFPAHGTIELVTVWFSGQGSHEQRIEILDPTGVTIVSPLPSRSGPTTGRCSF